MSYYVMFAIVAGLVMLFLLTEIVNAVLPVLIVITMVPPDERDGLAKVLAACDSSARLRVWRALRLAVKARRRQRAGDGH